MRVIGNLEKLDDDDDDQVRYEASIASLEASTQGTKTSDHGTFSLYMNIIFQIVRSSLTAGYVRQYNQGEGIFSSFPLFVNEYHSRRDL